MPRDRRATIGTGIWSEPSIRSLPRLHQQAYFLAYTQPDLNRCGVVAYRLRYWTGLAADATPDDLDNDFRALHDSRHIVLDPDDEQLFIRTYVKHDGLLAQPLVVAAMIRDFYAITSPVIRTAFLAEMRRLFDDPEIDAKGRHGLALLLGADPATMGMKNASNVATAIGTGLAGAFIDAINAGTVEPFHPADVPKTVMDSDRDALTGKGIDRGIRKGIGEGIGEGIGGGIRYPLARCTAPAPATAPASASTPAPTPVSKIDEPRTPKRDDPHEPSDEPHDAHADQDPIAIDAHNLVEAAVPDRPRAIKTKLADQVLELIEAGQDHDRISRALTRWASEPSAPGRLPYIVSDLLAEDGVPPRIRLPDTPVRIATPDPFDVPDRGDDLAAWARSQSTGTEPPF